ncbi:MAG: class II aldolase/adducin family protein [Deltaproteobacteria bacterium]|nr:class II aldolase/adducin family protein [Deltaproteobacteria bacterium]
MRDEELRIKLVEYGQRLMAEGLVTGPGGNLSARAGNIIYLSPSGLAFDEMGAGDYVGMDLNSGEVIEGEGRPTSEYLVHLVCYRKRSDIGAVVHTHPRYTVALSSAGHDIKAMFPDFHIYTHSKTPHIDYITVNTQELADAVEGVVEDANVIVLRNHGAVAIGGHLKEAYYRMASLEEGAQVQLLAMQVGSPRFLTKGELKELDDLATEKYRRKLLEQSE